MNHNQPVLKILAGPRLIKKTQPSKEALPPLCQQPPSPAEVLVSRPLFSHTRVLRNIASQQTISVKELRCHLAQLGHGRALNDQKGTVEAHVIASEIRTHFPDRITDAQHRGK